jgi:vacuolar-type H+-ATPase subunit C/Vma6
MPRRVSLLNYAYAIGRIRALEKYLLKEEVLHRAIESDLNEALRLFAESDIYGDGLLHIKNSQQLEGVLNHELSQLKELIRNLILDKELVGVAEINSLERVKDALGSYPSELLRDYLMHLIDMHNIKTFLRLYILKEPEERLNNLLVCEGFIKKDVLLKLYTQPLAALLNKLEYGNRLRIFLKRGYRECRKR